VQLSTVVKEAMKLLRPSIPSTIRIRSRVGAESGLVLADPTQMQQVLMNLCANAAYAMREKGGVLAVEVSDFLVSADRRADGMRQGPYVKLVVRDTGVGMPPEVVERAFDPFFTTKKPGEGTGLGLSIVHGIVEQHEGYITVESEPGKGSTFTLYLAHAESEGQVGGTGEERVPTGHERVLFVDDEEVLTQMGREMLEELGYEVTVKNDGIEALALFRADPSRLDLVMTDQTMPGMTGIELARELMSLRPSIPVIITTGFSDLVDAAIADAAGVRAFLMKPITRGELARTVRKALDG
jgi:CheY-like chemotaxis protein